MSQNMRDNTVQESPFVLYKIVSIEAWEQSKQGSNIVLSDADREFVHFSTKDQLERILTKYWHHAEQCIILKVDPAKLIGDLEFETNPGGTTKYYHLYRGQIPLDAIVSWDVHSK